MRGVFNQLAIVYQALKGVTCCFIARFITYLVIHSIRIEFDLLVLID